LADNPVGYWRLDETTVGTVFDSAGGNDNGTHNNFTGALLNQPGAPIDEVNSATRFNGINNATGSFIQGPLTATTFDDSWTIETWFNHTSQSQWAGLFSNNVAPQQASAPLLTMNADSNLFGINQAGVSAQNISVDLGAGHFNKWLYGAITYTAGTNLFDVYVYDPSVDPTGANPQHATGAAYWTLNENSNNFLIGRHWTSDTQIWGGLLDEVAVYNTALTQAQLTNHVVPEPTSLGLALAGGTAMLGLLRRRQA